MKIFKNSLALVLALILAFSSVGMRPERANAADKTFTTTDGFVVNEYQTYTNKWSIVGYTGHAKKLEIPEKIGDYPVGHIAKQAFKGNTEIEELIIPGSVYRLDKEAFMDCTSLKSVKFTQAVDEYYGESVRNYYLVVSDRVFAGCKNLKSIEFPFGVDFYDKKDVFADSGLEYAKVVYHGDTRINMMFNNAPELKRIDIYDGISISYLNETYMHDIPKLEEINIWPDYLGSHTIASFLNADIFNNPANSDKPYANCPSLKYINVYVGTDYIGRQYQPIQKSYSDDTWVTVEDDGCVERYGNINEKNSSRNVFVAKAEGTATFSCPETNIKVRLIIGDGNGTSKKDLKEAKVTLPADTFVFTGEEITPYAQLTYGDTLLVEDTDYTVKCEDNKAVGTAKITFTGKGDYTGSISADYYIGPDLVPVYLKKAVIAKKTAKLEWNTFKGADGYQVYYSTKKSKGYKKLYSGKDTSIETKTVKSGMFIKIRTYKKVGKKTYYSEWSVPVKVK